ncbi:malto-oligosyltrehalose synthase [Piscinibacter sakaiensis]|uniref:Malto-oligosyltrehalose synthase n=1 Tax=Piscinibacter sakaiensis TaxID=1547922 RepID=A0A0K8P312_PISS1|nr:malto-oligosyltrehalose synthase [Piscinibacter sakaiensis]GAP36914.1 malto-oligosyltrehalose synthase [Piscinibacter sakaiensis]
MSPTPSAAAPRRGPSRRPIGARIPRATYRLQLHADFGFDAAIPVLPYLARLGVSHVYCSPILRARPGSRHGYDVVDPAEISPELGGEAGFLRFAGAARALGLGLLLDQVPNHMGVFGADNAWWMDVLENGPASPHAAWFDIDWNPPNPALRGRLLVPVLGASYGEVLERGEIVLAAEPARGALVLRYHGHRFPLDPARYHRVLGPAASLAGGAAGERLAALAAAFAALPGREADAGLHGQRRERQRALQRELATTLAEPAPAAAVAEAVAALNAPQARDALDALHEAQAYRLAHWRMAADEINYRRFFDVNELAALRIEDPAVFEAVQAKALDLAAAGWIDGLRIDHPDGLHDPARYFERLQHGYARRAGLPLPAEGAAPGPDGPFRPLYVVAEKIAAGYEEVPRDWAVHGSTGYRFANLVNGLFVERANGARMERLWHGQVGAEEPQDFEALAVDCKRQVARGALSAQLTTLSQALQRLALRDRRTRDHGLPTLREALAEVAAAMPVYRTYVAPRGDGPGVVASAQDRRFVDWAIAQARRRSESIDDAVFDFIRGCLLGLPTVPGSEAEVGAFAMAFQQFCAPVAAKGVEDTAFYRWHRLVSLNEVGGEPARFGTSAAAFHGASADRARHWPHTLLASSTHDHKRSEDVRLRIDVLSEQPAAWKLGLTRWRTLTRPWRTEVDGREAPSRADQVLLHQTLLGTLPPGGLDEAGLPAYRERIEAYALKAAREAKRRTAWARPDPAYEAALGAFVRGLLARLDGNPALAELQARADTLAWFGALNSLSMTTLKFASPGVPDLYQGHELMALTLVDPDNRQPVDFAAREAVLRELEALREAADPAPALAALARTPWDGRLKLWILWQLLTLRRSQPALFESGSYLPLRVEGARRRHVLAFARRGREGVLLVAAGRKFAGLGLPPGRWPAAADWGDTVLRLPAALRGAGRELLGLQPGLLDGEHLAVGPLFARLPVAAVFVPRARVPA